MTQFISYPILLKIDENNFRRYYDDYINRIAFIAGPLMIAEIITGFMLLFFILNTIIKISFFILLLIWMSTFAIQVPIHDRLSVKHSSKLIKNLIFTNWIRTFFWIFKLLILCPLLLK